MKIVVVLCLVSLSGLAVPMSCVFDANQGAGLSANEAYALASKEKVLFILAARRAAH